MGRDKGRGKGKGRREGREREKGTETGRAAPLGPFVAFCGHRSKEGLESFLLVVRRFSVISGPLYGRSLIRALLGAAPVPGPFGAISGRFGAFSDRCAVRCGRSVPLAPVAGRFGGTKGRSAPHGAVPVGAAPHSVNKSSAQNQRPARPAPTAPRCRTVSPLLRAQNPPRVPLRLRADPADLHLSLFIVSVPPGSKSRSALPLAVCPSVSAAESSPPRDAGEKNGKFDSGGAISIPTAAARCVTFPSKATTSFKPARACEKAGRRLVAAAQSREPRPAIEPCVPAVPGGALGPVFGWLQDGFVPLGRLGDARGRLGRWWAPGRVRAICPQCCFGCFGQPGADPRPFGSRSREHFGVTVGSFWAGFGAIWAVGAPLRRVLGSFWGCVGDNLGLFGSQWCPF